ncbi:SDR family NAD(P)-dependent oxidoreductase [Salinisphaera sp. LB1]|uniref:SDR family NAD(P)-dependent oxidoreductase n=1 Tax=Salinisphaera sp. LB1 TaxID=2183911 RepID=UPI000D7DC037|nr:SDR family NAD(P)-dependent oxidoreductase [Salinisphaera sp. LB1]AWN15862.1 3-oxoacyl-[acyl-carrier protein] reductase [Salinisphaera sp. LB1]
MTYRSNSEPRIVLITGGLSGIGLACAHRFADEGDQVFVTTRSEKRAVEFAAKPGSFPGSIDPIVANLDTPSSIAALLKEVGSIDVLVNNAGLNRPRPFLEFEIEDFDAIMSVNLRSVFMVTQAVAKTMIEAGCTGKIVVISSQAGFVGLPERTAYCASKHAVEGLIKAVAVDLAGTGVQINSVAPTFVETEMTRETLARDEFRELINRKLLTEALPKLSDVANAVHFLASDRLGSITGTTLRVDGGWTAH